MIGTSSSNRRSSSCPLRRKNVDDSNSLVPEQSVKLRIGDSVKRKRFESVRLRIRSELTGNRNENVLLP
jgi:hypothetical protein